MQGTLQNNSHANLKSESVWFKIKLISQFLTLSFLLTQPFYLSYLHASPVGGNVVGGSGSISQDAIHTTINQSSQNLAINWQSFDVNANEHVHFVQPNSSSVALNRILGNNGSVIQGQIDANGQVILVNPNGVFFTSTATINVGSLIASSLDMTPTDFMNGNYIFNEVAGANGAVINSGLITASLGGNVALIGRQVKNTGLITAKLGSVVLAAGKQSVLTFDNQGLIGVKVTKEVLQNELGLEEAVINSGNINASGGRVLLTASVSQDVFSQAVNNGALNQATSVVVNADGTFTLGAGADVLNTGSIDVSSETNSNNTARIILLGENITSSGSIKADTKNGAAGEIEIHSKNKTLLIENSITSAQALASGRGGLIKVLGDKVGLFDQALVNASGANGGGTVLIGGDRQGLNPLVRNADFIYLGADTVVKADATDSGNGGKIITFANNTARIHGNLFARGGLIAGDGGFIETSGLRGFEITNAPDISAANGNGGLWLIDPYNITIVNTADCVTLFICTDLGASPFTPIANSTYLDVGLIETALLTNNANVQVNTGAGGGQLGDLTFQADLVFAVNGNANTSTLTLNAANDIIFTTASSITSTTNDSLNLFLNAGRHVTLTSDTVDAVLKGINLQGGALDIVSGGTVSFNSGTLDTAGGNIDIISSNAVDFNGATILTGSGNFDITSNATDVTSTTASSVTTGGGDFIVSGATNFNSSNVAINVGTGKLDLDGVTNDVTLGNALGKDLRVRDVNSVAQFGGTSLVFDDARFRATAATNSIVLLNANNDFNTVRVEAAEAEIMDIDNIVLDDGTVVTSLLEIKAGGDITDNGALTVSNVSGTAVANFDTTGRVILLNDNGNGVGSDANNFDRVNVKNATSVTLEDNVGGLAFAANSALNTGGITGDLTLNVANGDITSFGEVNAGTLALNQSNFTVDSGQSINLNNSRNTFTGQVFFKVPDYAGGDRIANITFTDDSALALENIEVTGNLIVSGDTLSFKHTHVNTGLGGGTFSATTTNASGGGTITQDGTDITVNGTATATFDATGNITLTDANNDFQDVTILNGNTVSLRDTDAISLLSSTTTGNLSIQAGGDISLVGDITTNIGTAAAGNVLLTGNVRLAPTAATSPGNTIKINTNAADTFTDGTVTFTGTVDNDFATTTVRNNLEITSGDGNVDFRDEIGTNTNIASLVINDGVVSNAVVNLQRVRTRAIDATNTANAIDITAGTINLADDLETRQGDSGLSRGIELNGNVVLVNDVIINANDSLSDGAVTITGTINSATTSRKLTINSDTAAVDLQQVIGGTNSLSALEINSGSGNGTVKLGAVTTSGGNNVIRVDGTTIELNGDINSNNGGASGDVRFDGDLVLNSSVAINSTGTGNGDVIVNGDINANNTTNTNKLTITSGSGVVDLNNVGNSEAIQQLTITNTSGDITVGSISTRDNTTIANDTGVVLTSTGTINLGGDITTNTIGTNGSEAGTVAINGDAVLNSNVTISTNTVSSSGAVSFGSIVDADSAGNNRNLIINAGAASVTFSNDVGANQALNQLAVNNALSTSLQAVFTGTGGIDVTSNTINLTGNLNTKDTANAGQIRLIGTVNINADTIFDTVGSSTDANILINGSVNNTVSRALTLNAGQADVTLTGTAGSGTALTSLTIDGNNVDLGQVTAIGAIDITGSTSIDLSGNLTTTDTTAAADINLRGGAVTLYSDVVLQTAGASSVVVEGTIDADANTNNRLLTINSGTGGVDLQGDVGTGTNQAIQGLTISNSNGVTNLQAVTSRSGGVSVTSNTLNLSGNIDTTDDAASAGAVTLTQDTLNLNANININTNSATGNDQNISILDLVPSDIAGNGNSFSLDAGTGGVVNITSNITNVSAFSVLNSLSTTLNGVTTNNGLLSVNASTDINLTGDYNSGIADMSFSADNDANYSGRLTLNTNSNFDGRNIDFSTYYLTAAPASLNATDTVTFSSTGTQINVGVDYNSPNFTLDNALLNMVNAANIQINNLSNSYVLFNNANITNTAALNVNAYRMYFYNIDSQLNNLNATATTDIRLYKNITSAGNISLDAPIIYSFNSIASGSQITSTSGDINITGNIGTSRALTLNATGNTVNLLGNTAVSSSSSLNINAGTINHGNVVANADINFVSGGTYTQTGNLQSNNGSISVTAAGNIALASNTTNAGSVTINSTGGSILDNNGPVVNIDTAGSINLTAANGIGVGDPLEIISRGANVSLTALNTTSGNIDLVNNGKITLRDVSNSSVVGGTFTLVNTGGNVVVNKLVLDKSSTQSVATFNVTGGDVLGVQGVANAHVTANTAIFQMNNTGSVGQLGSPLVTDVPNIIEVISATGTYIQFYGQVPPKKFVGDNAYRNRALQAIESLSGQQLIEVESLAEIDPAIFTDVRNYSHTDLALMMPSDQRYDISDEEEEDEEAKKKRQKLINSTP